MRISELLKVHREDILQLAAKHGAYNVRIFGSVARGEDRSDSDLDLLVDVGSNHSSWFPSGLIIDLEDLLGHHVDIVTVGGLHEYLRERVLQEAMPL